MEPGDLPAGLQEKSIASVKGPEACPKHILLLECYFLLQGLITRRLC
jgi:hypothetical protein